MPGTNALAYLSRVSVAKKKKVKHQQQSACCKLFIAVAQIWGCSRCMCKCREYLKGKYHCTTDLLFDWFSISCLTTEIFCFSVAKQINLNQSYRRSTVQWNFPLLVFPGPWFHACLFRTGRNLTPEKCLKHCPLLSEHGFPPHPSSSDPSHVRRSQVMNCNLGWCPFRQAPLLLLTSRAQRTKKRDRFSNKNYFLTISKATQLFGLFPEPKFKPPPHDKNGNDWKRPPLTEPDLRINAWTGSTTACIPKIFSKIPKKRYFTAVFSDL